MEELAFTIHRAEEGGFWAEGEGYPLFTQGEDLDELESMIRQAVAAYFNNPDARPRSICWRFEMHPSRHDTAAARY